MRKEEDDEWRGGIPERLQEEAAAMVEAGASTSHRVKLEHPIASGRKPSNLAVHQKMTIIMFSEMQ